MQLNLDRSLGTPLVQQLTEQLQGWIARQRLRPGARLPSIRSLAKGQGVSASCVIEAYDRLVASGWLVPRHGAGFFVAQRNTGLADDAGSVWSVSGDGRWRQFVEGEQQLLRLGCGWLPLGWRAEAELAHAIRQVSRGEPQALFDYCPPQGLASLRMQLHKGLAQLHIAAEPERILTTQGASHALDLLVRTLLLPGDTVLVERPGYYNLFNLLRQHGVHMLEVPRTRTGPDLAVLEPLLAEHRPRCLFINSLYQNPTGTSLTPKVAHRLLELARAHDLRIIEDDLYADFQDGPATRLATLDSEQRVIYLGSFSKTLSSSLRVGYLVAEPDLIGRLAELKMVSGIGTSRFAEQVIHQMLVTGSYRKSAQRLRLRLGQHRAAVLRQLEACGWEVFCEPSGGMFVWARVPGRSHAALEQLALANNVLLTPGSAFDPLGRDCDWLRINVAFGQDTRAQAFFQLAGRP